ncbi:hypothetical protein LPJ53_004417 [Coemansia erecta]|uniref:FAD dependent oxidoreductase domain-containing protein n=1 Tax=Coemansia erecta TaxID=147472 RepID=A0A9W7XX83_9FUNG|nr:hypothetical protein LPJ53_004417 [Coemansia erecta]
MPNQPVIVIGAGVIGLTVANKLLQSTCYDVTIVAGHIPDTIFSASMRSPKWASPWAGAHWRASSSSKDKLLQQMEIQTYNEMLDLAVNEPESGISTATGVDLYENLTEKPWYSTMVKDALNIPTKELPPGVSHGLQYTTLLINVPQYLVYLRTKFTNAGGKIVCRALRSISEALDVTGANSERLPVIVNCTGLGSKYLSDVADKAMYPIRGQTVLVHAPDAKRTITRIGAAFGYTIPRGDGSVILGGTAEKNSWETEPDSDTTTTILQRALTLEPALLPGDASAWSTKSMNERVAALEKSIISVNVGFRPMRDGGVRLETESFRDPSSGKQFNVVHCYGHAGYGYQSSLAFAQRVCELVDEAT